MKYLTRLDGVEREFTLERHGDRLVAHGGGRTYALDLALVGDGASFSLLVDGHSYDVVADVDRETVDIQMLGQQFAVHVEDERERAAHAVAGNKQGGKQELRAAMPGIVIDVKVAVGDQVEEGRTIVVLEAMKMQIPVPSPVSGTVVSIHVSEGATINEGDLIAVIDA